jgi:hypothetical protein
MALFQVNVEPSLLKQLIQVLQRIAAGIDRAYPVQPDPAAFKGRKPSGPETLIEFNPEAEWQREAEEEARQS